MLLRDPFSDDHFYRWLTSREALQEYWIRVRLPVPSGTYLSCNEPPAVRYRTALPLATHNSVSLRILDADGVPLATTRHEGLAATEWTSAVLSPTIACHRAIAGNTLTVLVRLAATRQGAADIGAITLQLLRPPALQPADR
jgi:hypothetical protein